MESHVVIVTGAAGGLGRVMTLGLLAAGRRVAAADINPYLAIAAALGSGLWGIENKVEPDAPISGNAYDIKHDTKRNLPRSLAEAAERLSNSKVARELFGDVFVDHYAMTRHWEEREFRKAITDWELSRYFETI